MTALQLAAISLILISFIVCQTLRYNVGSLFFINLSRISNAFICPWQKYLSWFRFLFLPAVLRNLYIFIIARLKIRNTISLAIVLTIIFMYTFSSDGYLSYS